MPYIPDVPEGDDARSVEELQREKLMLEIQKLRQDMIQAQRADQREGWKLLVAFVGGGAAFLAAAAAIGKVFFGG